MEKLYILFCMSLLLSCSTGSTKHSANENIDPIISELINTHEQSLLKYLSRDKIAESKSLMADHYVNSYQGDLDGFLMQTGALVNEHKLTMLDQYHITNSKDNLKNILYKSDPKKDNYTLKMTPSNKEAFVSLRIIESSPYQLLLTMVHSKYNDEWKLDLLKVKKYAAHQLNADDLFLKAKINYEKGNIFDANNEINLASKLYKPSGRMFYYRNAGAMKTLLEAIVKKSKVKYPLPIEMEELTTTPKIINFNPVALDEGIFPSITYLTTVNIKDTTALRIENEEIHKRIDKVFDNIKSRHSKIHYMTMNEIPSGTNAVETYRIIKEQ